MYKGILDTPLSELQHHGVKGMKWGVKNVKSAQSSAKKHQRALRRMDIGDSYRKAASESNSMRNEMSGMRSKHAKSNQSKGKILDKSIKRNDTYKKQSANDAKRETKRKFHQESYNSLVKQAAAQDVSIKMTPKRAKSKAIAKQVLTGYSALNVASLMSGNPYVGLAAGIGTVGATKERKTKKDRFLEDVNKQQNRG